MNNDKWHALNTREVLEKLKTDPKHGLPDDEVKERLRIYGLNELTAKGGRSLLKIILGQILNLFMLLLLSAAIIAIIVGETSDAYSIIAIMAIMIFAGVIQEYRAEKTLEKLKSMAIPKARVLRNGRLMEIDSRQIVPGDILILSEGDRVAADARLIEARDLSVDESMLTGESHPIAKKADVILDPLTPLADRINMVYSGTYVVRGTGKAVVVATGMKTELGRIAQMVAETAEEKTRLHVEMDKLAKQLGGVIIGIAVAVLILAIIVGAASPIEALLTSIALAVAAVPEGLPAVLTMILALGVMRMARRNALVRRLGAVESLGRVTVIATDKTGTLTRNEMTVTRIWLPSKGVLEISGSGYLREGKITYNGNVLRYGELEELDLLIENSVLCNNSDVDYSVNPPKPIGDPLEAALVVLAYKSGIDPGVIRRKYRRIHEIPFSSERKMMSVVIEKDNKRILYSKGAPETILSKSRYYIVNGVIKELNKEKKEEFLGIAEELASKGLRILGHGYRVLGEDESEQENIENDLVFIGFTGFIDPPRPEVPGAIKKAIDAGINVVMVTGDHAITAKAVAEMIGLPLEGKTVVTGRELDLMGDEELEKIIDNVAVFARVSPEHKLRIVKAFKKKGHVVAMTGDGVNDAPALKLADVGVAMGLRGTDVAREAADLILEDDNFATIVAAVEEGRTSYNNIRKSTLYLLSANVAEVLVVLGSILLLDKLLLTPAMILWINLVTDSLPAITLGLEPPEPDVMKKPPTALKPLLGKTGLYFLGYIGVVLSLLTWFSASLRPLFAATAAYLALSISELAHSFNMRSPDKSLLEIGFTRNKYHILGYIIAAIIAIAPIYLMPWLLKATPLPLIEVIEIFIITHIIIVIEEIRKRVTTKIP
ncbi:MAG: cation-translocating P-type ATPase [Desulfurococcales archaeon]|nr:cation-translocating P-type ATPase [Desulfurococcales archaeon]